MMLQFNANGTAIGVYSDEILDALESLGQLRVVRASHVEPSTCGGWTADMAPVGGPVLGTYRTRTEALDAEQAWLAANLWRMA